MVPFPEKFGGPSTHQDDVTSPLESPPEVGDNLAANRGEEVIVHDMNEFNRRMISSICVTEEGALKINIWEKKRKIEIASAAKAIDRADQIKIQNAIESSE